MEKIVITTTSFGQYDSMPLEILKKNGFEVVRNPYGRKVTPDEAVALCQGAAGLIAGTETLDSGALSALTGLKVISRCGTGMDNVDIDAANKLGIKVFNTPDAPTQAVAELTVGLILNLLRKVSAMHLAVRQGKWEKMMGNLLSEKNVGIVGFGRIGKKVAELLQPFGCTISYCDPQVKTDMPGLKRLGLEALLEWAEIISLHVSGEEQLIGAREIGLMKKGAWLVNAARGGLVDESALYQALRDGKLSGAALDVFAAEPYAGELKGLDNVILTPHIGSYARESRIKMEIAAVENLLTGLRKR